MIYLIHGPDIVSSRTFLLKLKSQYESAETINPKDLEKNPQILESFNLFEEKRLLVIEKWLPKERNVKLQSSLDLVFWLDDLVQPPSWVDKVVVFKLSEQATGFKLADVVAFGQEKQALLILEKLLLENTPSELIIGILTRQLRLLALGLKGEWDKVSKSSFLQGKVKDQIKFWDRRKLKNAALLLLKADWDIKTGNVNRNESLLSAVSKLCQLTRN